MVDTNDAPAESSVLIRTGRDGRQRYGADYKRQVLDAFEGSGMSGKAFAEQCGVKYPTFASWLAKRRRGGKEETAADHSRRDAPAFLLAEIGDGGATDALEVTLPGGVTVRAGTPAQVRLLATLIAALR